MDTNNFWSRPPLSSGFRTDPVEEKPQTRAEEEEEMASAFGGKREMIGTATEKKDATNLGPAFPTDSNKVVYSKQFGRFLVGGEQLTLTELLFQVTGKAASSAKEMLAMTAQNLTDANKDGNAALAWRNKLSALEPDSAAAPKSKVDKAVAEFKNEYGFDPMEKYDLAQFKESNGAIKKENFEKLDKGVESYISTVSNNQSKINLDVERYTHIVNEANQLSASVNKAISDLLSFQTGKM